MLMHSKQTKQSLSTSGICMNLKVAMKVNTRGQQSLKKENLASVHIWQEEKQTMRESRDWCYNKGDIFLPHWILFFLVFAAASFSLPLGWLVGGESLWVAVVAIMWMLSCQWCRERYGVCAIPPHRGHSQWARASVTNLAATHKI